MIGWLRLFLSVVALTSAFGLFRGSALGFFSQPEIEFVIRLGVAVSSAPFLLPFVILQDISRDFSPPQVRYVEVPQPKCTQDLPQLVETKGLGEDVSVLSIRRNILKFDFTGEDALADKVEMHLNVLSLGVEDVALC